MLAQQPLQREDAATTVPPGPGRPAHLRDRTSAVLDALDDVAVADDLAVADDHAGKATLTIAGQSRSATDIGPRGTISSAERLGCQDSGVSGEGEVEELATGCLGTGAPGDDLLKHRGSALLVAL